MKQMKRFFSLLLTVCMLLTLLPGGVQAAETENVPILGEEQTQEGRIAPEGAGQESVEATGKVTAQEIENPGVDLRKHDDASEALELPDKDETVRVIVVLEQPGLLEQGYTTAQIASNGAEVSGKVQTMAQLQSQALADMETLTGMDLEARYQYNVAFNGLSVEVPYGELEQIRQIPNVKSAFVAEHYDVPEPMPALGNPADPLTNSTKDHFGSALTWENLGYTGQGMRVAVIDTGLDLDHPSFADAPALTDKSLKLEEVQSVLTTLNAYQRYTQTSTLKLTAEKLYRSEKVPYAFNYVDSGLDVTHDHDNQGDHGTHVSGIIAANPLDTTPVVGVAPDAQLMVMKVFGKNGGAYFDDIAAALEDCYRLNADAVNLSLGAPAGFCDEGEHINEIYGKILDSDMIVAIAVGNSNSAANMNGYGTNKNLTCDPDIGLVSSPATYVGATGVASSENTTIMLNYLTVGGENVAFTDMGAMPFTGLAGEEREYVMVPGYGSPEDFAKVNVKGKIAVVSRGSSDPQTPVTFVDKQTNAKKYGAVGCIVYDNVVGPLINMMDAQQLPNAFVSMESGAILKEAAGEDGIGVLEVKPLHDLIGIDSSTAGQLSDFSSWGVTPDLQLNPDVTAPGGNIYSSVGNGKYGTMSGTSMACPHIAGMSALVLQHLHTVYPDLTEAQMHTVAEALIMSTAEPALEPTGVLYSPRKQGAGIANVYRAVTCPAYLTVNGDTPKISFGDDDNRTGVYQASFEIHNLSDKEMTYALDGSALTDQVDLTHEEQGYLFMSESSKNLDAALTFRSADGTLPKQYDYNGDGLVDQADVQALLDAVNGLTKVKAGYDLNGDETVDTADVQKLYERISAGYTALDQVTVPAGGSTTVYVTVTLSQEDKQYMDTYYENGIYVDGFVRLYGKQGDLSLPFVGFYGDWSAPRIFDTGWYYEGKGGADAEFNRYLHVIFTDFGEGAHSNLGINPYMYEEYDPSHNVLSPNGDGYLDKIDEIYLSMLRGAKVMDFTWTDDAGNQLFHEQARNARKSYYNNAFGVCLPFIYGDVCEVYDFLDEDGQYVVKNNDKIHLTVDAYLDDGDLNDGQADKQDLDESMTIDMVVDTEKPMLYTDEIAFLYNPYTDSRYLEFFVSDNYGIAAVVPMTMAGEAYSYVSVEDVPGEKQLIRLDVSEYDASFKIAVCDYGCNESFYEINFAGAENINPDAFYGYRRYSTRQINGYLFTTDQFNGWYSFETPDEMRRHTDRYASMESVVAAAEYVDGYIIGIDADSEIFTMKAGTWDRTKLGTLKAGTNAWNKKTYSALDMAFDYTTDTLYVLSDELNENEGGHLMTVDYLTGEVTDLGIIEGINHNKTQLLTLACDNDGVLYAIDIASGTLHTIDVETMTATAYASATGYYPAYAQSMTVDHETNKLYWAGYQGKAGRSYFMELDKETGNVLSMVSTMDNGEMCAVFKPWDCGRDLFPGDTEATGLVMSKDQAFLTVGETVALNCMPQPYYAQLAEATWTSDNEAVAVVHGGVVEAKSVGAANITAKVGDMEASCKISVNNVTGALMLYNNRAEQWVTLGAGMPQKAYGMADTVKSGPVTAAAYYNGNVYAFDCAEEETPETGEIVYKSTFYKLDAKTLNGHEVGTTDQKVTAMAFNYADGFMYALTVSLNTNTWEEEYALNRVNPLTGELAKVETLDNAVFGSAFGGMAIDEAGSFYFMVTDPNEWVPALVRAELQEDVLVETARAFVPEELAPNASPTSMLYSLENKGILWADENNMIHWIDVSNMEQLEIVTTGFVAGQKRSAHNTALVQVVSKEPQVPVVAPTKVSIPERFEVIEFDEVQIQLSLEPWNATCKAAYATEDQSIATVSEDGLITAHKAGETTLTVTVPGLEPVTAQIVVTPDLGSLFGFYRWDYGDGMNGYEINAWGRMPILRPADSEFLTAFPDIMIYAGAYYDGYVYAFGQSNVDFMFYTLRVDPATFSYEVLYQTSQYVRDMTFDYTTGTMFAIVMDENYQGALAQMNMTDGTFTVVGDTGTDIITLASDNEGILYTVDTHGMLYTVDKSTAELTEVGSTGMRGTTYQSMHYDWNNDTLYWSQSNDFSSNLVEVDRTTGEAKKLGTIDGNRGAMIGRGINVTSLYSIPETEPQVPETVKAMGVCLPERAAAVVGKDMNLTATVLPISVSSVDKTLTWSSDNEAVATVSADGTITPVAMGTATITATTAQGQSDTCIITVLDHERKFYGYDERNTQWITFDDNGKVTVVRDDAENEAPILASVLAGDVLYSYDKEGYFYSIDPETFERTKLGNGIHGLTETLKAQDKWIKGEDTSYTVEKPYRAVDMAWDAETGKLYVTLEAYNISKYLDSFMAIIAEVDPATGEITNRIIRSPEYRPAGLVCHNGELFFVDGFTSGMLTRVDPSSETLPLQYAIFAQYWGDFDGGRSLIKDELTGEFYGIRDLRSSYYEPDGGHESVLCQVGLGNAWANPMYEIGSGIIVNSLFIY